jgi:hypothetical protein
VIGLNMQTWDVSPRPVHSPCVVLQLSGSRSGVVAPTGSSQSPVVSGSISTQQDVPDLSASSGARCGVVAPAGSLQSAVVSGSSATQQDVVDLTASRSWGFDPWAPRAVASTASLQLPVVSCPNSTQQDVLGDFDPWAPPASSRVQASRLVFPSGSNASSFQPVLDGPYLYPSITNFYNGLSHAQKFQFCKEIDEDLEVAHCVQLIDDTHAFDDVIRAWRRHTCSTTGCRSKCWSCLEDYEPHQYHYCEQCYLAWQSSRMVQDMNY